MWHRLIAGALPLTWGEGPHRCYISVGVPKRTRESTRSAVTMSIIYVLSLSGTLQNTIIGLLVLTLFAYLIRQHWRLRHFPGPFLASLSNLQRAYWVQTGRSQEVYYDLHSRYGDFVRLGPSMVSISDPNLMSAVYPIRPGIPKVRNRMTRAPPAWHINKTDNSIACRAKCTDH
jgi:hypothetical protein